jgi:UDP-glucose 4-epimerase
VLHQAAIPSVPKSVIDPISSHNADLTGTLHVLWAAKEAGVKRLVYAAFFRYGDNPELPKREEMPSRAISPYGLMKYVGEEYCRLFTQLYGLETVSLRYFNVFGPRQDPSSQYSGVLSRFITAMLAKSPVVFGDGEQAGILRCRNVVRETCWHTMPQGSRQMYNLYGQHVNLNQVVSTEQYPGNNAGTDRSESSR